MSERVPTLARPRMVPAARSAVSELWRDFLAFLAQSQGGARLWAAYDLCIAATGTFLGFRFSPSFTFAVAADVNPWLVIALYAFFFLLAAVVMGVYEPQSLGGRFSILLRVSVAAAVAWGVLLSGHYLFAYQVVGRWIVATSGCLCVALCAFPRMLLLSIFRQTGRRVLVVGDDDEIRALSRLVDGTAANGYRIVGSASRRDLGADETADRTANAETLLGTCEDLGADVVVMAGDINAQTDGLLGQAIQCLERGIQVTSVASFVEETFQKVPVELVGAEWLVSANLHVDCPYLCALKRGFDIMVAGVGLAVTLPLWPLFAVLVKLGGPGPVFYSQARVGRFGRPFTIHKFRTMSRDAERDGRPRWASRNDPRVTSMGRMLRNTRIDELPQLWNILKGDMSFVGPRPERPAFMEGLAAKIPCYSWRHLVRPGLTGWAQIAFRYGASEEDAREKLRYDLYYVKHVSFSFDLYIFLRTLSAILKGAR